MARKKAILQFYRAGFVRISTGHDGEGSDSQVHHDAGRDARGGGGPTLFFRSLKAGWKGAIEPAMAEASVVSV